MCMNALIFSDFPPPFKFLHLQHDVRLDGANVVRNLVSDDRTSAKDNQVNVHAATSLVFCFHNKERK